MIGGHSRQKLHRRVGSRKQWPDVIIYTDAAKESMITAILVFDRATSPMTGGIVAVRTEVGSAERVELFLEANFIYN